MSDSARPSKDVLEKIRQSLRDGNCRDAADEATEALKEAELDPVLTAELSLLRADALQRQGLSASVEDLLRAANHATQLTGDRIFLIEALASLQRVDEALRVADALLELEPGDRRTLYLRTKVLRQAGRQDEALRGIRDTTIPADDRDFLALKAALLCDISDFAGTLGLLRPVTTPIESADHFLLSQRGWADQNSSGREFAEDGELVYREACRKEPDDLWYRKGLANALGRLGKKEEAATHYQGVIAKASELKLRGELDAYTTCLAGWCYFRLGQLKEATQYYAAGLGAKEIGAAVQFDYALILLVDGRHSGAVSEYLGGIQEAKSRNVLRQCGILYIALFDLRNAVAENSRLAELAETGTSRKSLREAILECADRFDADWAHLADRMRAYARSDEQECAAQVSLGGESWSQMRVAGFCAPAPGDHADILMPVLTYENAPDRFQLMGEGGPESGTTLDLQSLKPKGAVLLDGRHAASAGSRILFASAEFLKAANLNVYGRDGEGLSWIGIDVPVPSVAAVTTRDTAESLLNAWARLLVARAAEDFVEGLRPANEDRLSVAADTARFALQAARKDLIVYQAALLYGAAAKMASEEKLLEIRPGLPQVVSQDPSELWKRIEAFGKLARLFTGQESYADHHSIAEIPKSLAWANPISRRIFQRVREIARISDQGQQDREAALAGAEIQLLAPAAALKSVHQSLVDCLKYYMMFYLETDESFLAMGREPAFYTASVLRTLSHPAVDSFAFCVAAQRLRDANSTLGVDALALRAGSAA